MHSELDDQRVLQICLAHLVAAIKTSKDLREMSGDPSVQASMLSPLLILSSDLLTSSTRYHNVGGELASYAMNYSLRIAETHCGKRDVLTELTDKLEHYIEWVIRAQRTKQSVTVSQVVQ
ncbi:hypothetical protein OPW41_11740 [Vibrio europaeus]|uniref:hypothetical protein n=1 Tax=Vibrio europaeus TaxID=300876 RepID=UPI00233F508A|nr:hypothetical protein [Vibrio europaeus]MDC5721947.1 hypothetical protein [Vibrio europaeus]MDC5758070.1 hypothetical protein [Vibrio europaeus]MDC5776352.1 hypothetical protein [Vibrio europaeus]MDC5795502.1 hypothetical protein [Vibrio europaeus]MDC5798325.1 hypothetical protein [Vibrio europaeus]